jgi:hypothetical protein
MSPGVADQDQISVFCYQTFSKNSKLKLPIPEKLFEDQVLNLKMGP